MKKKPMTVTEFARLGGRARSAKMTKAERVASAKKAVAARWRKVTKKRGKP